MPGASGWNSSYVTGVLPPGQTTPIINSAEVVHVRRWLWREVGVLATSFGYLCASTNVLADNVPYVHNYGPMGTFWDGHVETVTPPPLATPFAQRKNCTRDGTADPGPVGQP